MKPYLYMNRNREVLKHGNLKIFIDDIDLLGKYVEIEYQDGEDELKRFMEEIQIKDEPAKLYGDIFKELLNDSNFKIEFDNKLSDFLKKY